MVIILICIFLILLLGIKSNNTNGVYNFSHIKLDYKEVEQTESVPEEGEKGNFKNMTK